MITDLELFEQIQLFNWLLKKKYYIDTHGEKSHWDISRGQGRILYYLSIHPDGLSTKSLSQKIGIRTSSLNEILAKLENSGCITRSPSEADKRVIINALTPEGWKMVPALPDYSFFDCLSSAQRDSLSECFSIINENLESILSHHSDTDFESMCQQRHEAFQKFLEERKETGETF